MTIACILLVQFVGVPFAILFGKLARRIGAKRGILIALAGYLVVCAWASRITETWEFVGICLLVGMVQGGAQALSRSLFSTLIPKHKSGEFFGLFSTLDKFAGILGPLVFGARADRARGRAVGGRLLRRRRGHPDPRRRRRGSPRDRERGSLHPGLAAG